MEKREEGTGVQPHWKPPLEILGCTREATTVLNTVTVKMNIGVKNEMKLLVDTEAELCLLKHSSLKEGTVYNPSITLNVRGISNETERTLGEVDPKLIVGNYETEHKFHVVGSGMNIPCDGILGKDFFESKQATIDYVGKEITMGKVALKFDNNKQTRAQNKEILVVLKPRSETIVKLPTKSDELETGLIDSTEIAPGIIIGR
jgi:hypothetical protein